MASLRTASAPSPSSAHSFGFPTRKLSPSPFSFSTSFIYEKRRSLCPKTLGLKSSKSDATTPTATSTSTGGGSSSLSDLYSAKQYELTLRNVDFVLEDVRPYLISDGGNVEVVSVEDGVISLRLQGACESCPSSTTTMKIGIERVLKEKFGDAVKEIRQIYDELQLAEITVEAVNSHLDILRPAIKNYGGSVDVMAVEGGDCTVKYVGPESIGSGIIAAIKERFPDIVNVVLVTTA